MELKKLMDEEAKNFMEKQKEQSIAFGIIFLFFFFFFSFL